MISSCVIGCNCGLGGSRDGGGGTAATSTSGSGVGDEASCLAGSIVDSSGMLAGVGELGCVGNSDSGVK